MTAVEQAGCADCKRGYDTFDDFHVETAIWNYVFGGQEQTTYTVRPGVHDPRLVPRAEGLGGVLCLDCFSRRAEALGIDFSDYLRDPTAPDLSAPPRQPGEPSEGAITAAANATALIPPGIEGHDAVVYTDAWTHVREMLKAAYAIDGLPSRPAVEGAEHDCERELRAHPGYSISQGRPPVFVCSCGVTWEHYDDEAEGGGWGVVETPHPSPSGEADEVEAVAREMRDYAVGRYIGPVTAARLNELADRLSAASPRGAELQEGERDG